MVESAVMRPCFIGWTSNGVSKCEKQENKGPVTLSRFWLQKPKNRWGRTLWPIWLGRKYTMMSRKSISPQITQISKLWEAFCLALTRGKQAFFTSYLNVLFSHQAVTHDWNDHLNIEMLFTWVLNRERSMRTSYLSVMSCMHYEIAKIVHLLQHLMTFSMVTIQRTGYTAI